MNVVILTLFACGPSVEENNPEIRMFQTSLSQIESDLNVGFSAGLPNMFQVAEEYEEVLIGWGDETCPEFSQQTSSVDGHWVDDCVTADGNRFFGFATFAGLAVQSPDNYGNGGIFSSVWGSFDAIHANGEKRTVGGLGQMAIVGQDGGFDMNLRGSFWLNDSELWMQNGSNSLVVSGSIYNALFFNGGIQYPRLTVVFDELMYDVNQCNGTASGTMKIRDASGYWFEWTKAPCEDCAVIKWEGYDVGRVCVGESLDNAIEDMIGKVDQWIPGE